MLLVLTHLRPLMLMFISFMKKMPNSTLRFRRLHMYTFLFNERRRECIVFLKLRCKDVSHVWVVNHYLRIEKSTLDIRVTTTALQKTGRK